jgi:hypothetical protein
LRKKAAVYKVVHAAVTGVPRIVYDSRLDRFLHARGIPIVHLARVSGHSRQHILRLRAKQVEATESVIRNLTAACIVITGDLAIKPDDLVEVTPTEDVIASARLRDERHRGAERRHRISVQRR